jgi:uncharacterized protein
LQIPVPHGHLEASLREPSGAPRGAAVVCHPLPTHGGTMHTKAVFRTAQALNDAGISALRFNFRGVGTSTGTFDRGVGEQDDARAALDWLEQGAGGLPLLVAGFSFGSRVGLSVGARDPRVAAMVGLGVPVDLYDFTFLKDAGKPILVVQGDEDEFATGARAEEVLAPLGSHITLVRIPGADHYFHDRFDELKSAITEYFLQGEGAGVLAAAGSPG